MSTRPLVRQANLAGTHPYKESPMATAQTAVQDGLEPRHGASVFQQSDMISIADLSPAEVREIFSIAQMLK